MSGGSSRSDSTKIPPRETLRERPHMLVLAAGDVHVGLERDAHQSAHGQAQEVVHRLDQRHAVDRLLDHVVGAGAHRALVLLADVAPGHDDDGSAAQIRIAP